MTRVHSARAAVVGALGAVLFVGGLVLPVVVEVVDGALARRRRPTGPSTARSRIDSIEVIVPAFLEATVVADTVRGLKSSLADCPVPATVTVVASDEDTARAAEGVADVVLRVPRRNKQTAVNAGIAQSTADAVVLTDANCRIEPPHWPRLALAALEEADLVSAHKRERGGVEGIYWRAERLIKGVAEHRTGTLSVVGEFLALRRADFVPVPDGELFDDFFIARSVDARGGLVVVDPAIETVEDAPTQRDQWERRVRMSSGHFILPVSVLRGLATTPAGRSYLTHKYYRQTVGDLGFWIAVVVLPWGVAGATASAAALGLVGWCVAWYSGLARVRPPVGGQVAAVVGMQAVPPFGIVRAARRTRAARTGAVQGWEKIQR